MQSSLMASISIGLILDDGTVNQIAVGTNNGTPLTLAIGPSGYTNPPSGIATDGINVYWTYPGSRKQPCNGLNSDTGTVYQIAVSAPSGTMVTTLASNQNYPSGIATNGKSVYWTVNNTVNQIAVGGGSPLPLASHQSVPSAIATDGVNVYWTDAGIGTVNQIGIGGGSPVTLASHQINPSAIATDGINVYWTNNEDVKGSVNQITAIGGACEGKRPMCFSL